MEGKRVQDSEVVLTQIMQPEHANILGNIHGGWMTNFDGGGDPG